MTETGRQIDAEVARRSTRVRPGDLPRAGKITIEDYRQGQAEAVYAVLKWMNCGIVSTSADKAAAEFCDKHGLGDPRDGWTGGVGL